MQQINARNNAQNLDDYLPENQTLTDEKRRPQSQVKSPEHVYVNFPAKHQQNLTSATSTDSSSCSAIQSSTEISNQGRFMRSFVDGDFDFLKNLSLDELQARLSRVDVEMDQEIDQLSRRYQTKRQPILDALDQKKQRMTNF
uniref:Non-specific serine/threonine protein kinase n=1 Tax=Romanomermis culicivorax TaxID=13658 RepID=A0A915IN80_ROMCU